MSPSNLQSSAFHELGKKKQTMKFNTLIPFSSFLTELSLEAMIRRTPTSTNALYHGSVTWGFQFLLQSIQPGGSHAHVGPPSRGAILHQHCSDVDRCWVHLQWINTSHHITSSQYIALHIYITSHDSGLEDVRNWKGAGRGVDGLVTPDNAITNEHSAIDRTNFDRHCAHK